MRRKLLHPYTMQKFFLVKLMKTAEIEKTALKVAPVDS
jgi:hypothetical protein